MPTGTLPSAGKKIWEDVYNKALKGSCKKDKQCAARTAWSAVEGAGWHKTGGKWVHKSGVLVEIPMYITKAVVDGKVMRWAAVNSDTDPDSHFERMSLDLYKDFISHIINKDSVPEIFRSSVCSDFWCGGMPYLSISHYPDLNGQAVPGEPIELFVDGNKLKAKGILYNSPLGHSVFRSLKEDKNKNPEEKIRISIGFLDLAHKHGENGNVWVRDSLGSACPECLAGVGDKVYVKGYLVHLALTRVPVNKRTQMVLEEKSEMNEKALTRKDDAASIVGDTLATEIDIKNKAQTLKSDILVEMSEGENPTPEEAQELIDGAESAPAVALSETVTEESAKKECMKEDGTMDEDCMDKMKSKSETVVEEAEIELFDAEKAEGGYGGYLVADRGDGQPALPTKKNGKLDHRLMGAAWAALHGGYRGNKYEGKGKQEAIAKLTRLYKKEGIETPKSEAVDEEEVEVKAMGMDMPMNLPYGGATSMKDAQKTKDAIEQMAHVMDMWSMLSNVVWNIIDRNDVTDKKGAVVKAVDEFKSMLAAKAMVEFSQTQPVSANVEKAENIENSDHPLKPALDALLATIDNSLNVEGDVNSKLQFIQPSLQEFGEAITGYVSQKSVAVEPPAQDKNQDNLLEKITELIQPLSDGVQDLRTKVGILEQKSNATTVANNIQPKNRIPQPRTFQSSVVQKTESAETPKPGSLKSIIRKSVGL